MIFDWRRILRFVLFVATLLSWRIVVRPLADIGEFVEGEGICALFKGKDITPERLGWLHG